MSTVISMLPCPVLRCTNPGAAFVMDRQGLGGRYREAYVCAEHKALIDAGSPWHLENHSVVIGQDVPPVLESWSARPSLEADGFTLTLHIAGRTNPVDVFMTPTEARTLAVFINATNSASGRHRLSAPEDSLIDRAH
ncbi:hypothetical protein [Arthrobacter burdickii]|uniref:Uncharacterized protein n=1 Tax=Arthrobacter burdickii TaxID=3035920 RepID=A0ABT8K482_9MICC|nr:hypothetical protein [Arthrobacter burdickii]MDN4611803.1 hypothetical protein [Arthrobacter burdickii]